MLRVISMKGMMIQIELNKLNKMAQKQTSTTQWLWNQLNFTINHWFLGMQHSSKRKLNLKTQNLIGCLKEIKLIIMAQNLIMANRSTILPSLRIFLQILLNHCLKLGQLRRMFHSNRKMILRSDLKGLLSKRNRMIVFFGNKM
jgi:hypothetical protein